jgi:hypothetical protein
MLWPCSVLCASVPSRMGGACTQICVERELGGIVVVTPIGVEVRTSSWWNDRSHVGLERGSYIPVHRAWSCMSHRQEWTSWWGPRGSPPCQRAPCVPQARQKYAKRVRRSHTYITGVGQGGDYSRWDAGVLGFDDALVGTRQPLRSCLRLSALVVL